MHTALPNYGSTGATLRQVTVELLRARRGCTGSLQKLEAHMSHVLYEVIRAWRLRKALWYTGVVLVVSLSALLPEARALQVTPTSLSFQAVQGGTNPPSQIVNILKNNNHTLNWSSSDNATWVSVSP